MKKNGFTLIELLAVIVILAIIALIATPLILGVIDKAKAGAAKASAQGYVDATEKQVVYNQLKSENLFELTAEENQYELSDLISKYGVSVKRIKNADSGKIVLDQKGIVKRALFLIDNFYICYTPNKIDVSKDSESNDLINCNGLGIKVRINAKDVSYETESNKNIKNVAEAMDDLYTATK